MHVPLAERPLSDGEALAVREHLIALHQELDAQMRRASAVLDELRATTDVSDPAVQGPLMAALRSLDSGERETAEVLDALSRLADGRYGRCDLCDATIAAEVLFARPLTRSCER